MIYKTRKKREFWVSTEVAIEKLCEFWRLRGRFPRCQVSACRWCDEDLELSAQLKLPNISSYIYYLKSYRTACEIASNKLGIPYVRSTNSGRMRGRTFPFYSREYLLEVLIDYKNKTGQYPTHNQLHHPLPSYHPYANIFGGMTQAKKAADERSKMLGL